MPLAQGNGEGLIVQRLRLAMDEEEVSINELARRTGIARPQISSYVNGRVTPGWRNLARMAIALGRPASWFLP